MIELRKIQSKGLKMPRNTGGVKTWKVIRKNLSNLW